MKRSPSECLGGFSENNWISQNVMDHVHVMFVKSHERWSQWSYIWQSHPSIKAIYSSYFLTLWNNNVQLGTAKLSKFIVFSMLSPNNKIYIWWRIWTGFTAFKAPILNLVPLDHSYAVILKRGLFVLLQISLYIQTSLVGNPFLWKNKKVLLRERKRHTARRVASTRTVVPAMRDVNWQTNWEYNLPPSFGCGW